MDKPKSHLVRISDETFTLLRQIARAEMIENELLTPPSLPAVIDWLARADVIARGGVPQKAGQ